MKGYMIFLLRTNKQEQKRETVLHKFIFIFKYVAQWGPARHGILFQFFCLRIEQKDNKADFVWLDLNIQVAAEVPVSLKKPVTAGEEEQAQAPVWSLWCCVIASLFELYQAMIRITEEWHEANIIKKEQLLKACFYIQPNIRDHFESEQ